MTAHGSQGWNSGGDENGVQQARRFPIELVTDKEVRK